jgi:acetyltransferase-like isoleucine patch superfamily enzyme
MKAASAAWVGTAKLLVPRRFTVMGSWNALKPIEGGVSVPMGLVPRRKFPEVLLRIYEMLLLDPVSTCWARLVLWLWGATVGRDLKVSGRIRFRLQGTLHIGNRVRLLSGYSNYVGANEPMGISVWPSGELRIGNGCGLSNTIIVCGKRIDILDETFIGGGCRIYDTDFHQLSAEDRLAHRGDVPSAPIRIGPQAFVGGHCIILKGISIGEGAVIGAGSVVTRDVPPFEIWAGVPARKIREFSRT